MPISSIVIITLVVCLLLVLIGLVVHLVKQNRALLDKLEKLTLFSAERLDNIGVAVDANVPRNDQGFGLNNRHKALLTDAERLIPVFTEILAPAAMASDGLDQIYLSMQKHRFDNETDEDMRRAILADCQTRFDGISPKVKQARDIDTIMLSLRQVRQEHETWINRERRNNGVEISQIASNQEKFTEATRDTLHQLQSTNARMEAALQTRFDQQLFELTSSVPARLSRVDEKLLSLDDAGNRRQTGLLRSFEELITRENNKIAKNMENMTGELTQIMHETAESQAIADAVRGLKIHRLNNSLQQGETALPALQSSPVLTLISNLEQWIANTKKAYTELREPLNHGDSLSRYSAFVLGRAGLKDCLTDMDIPLIERMGLFLEKRETEEFLRLWGNPEDPTPHTTLIKIRFLLENMLCPLLQEQPEHPIFEIRENIVPLCESLTRAAKLAGVLIHYIAPRADQTISRWYIDPCGDNGRVSQALLNSRIEFIEILKNWLYPQVNKEEPDNPVIELCVVGYSLTGKGRPEVMSRASCYRDIAWQIA